MVFLADWGRYLFIHTESSLMENHLKPEEVKPSATLKPSAPEHWRVLLAEFVHLLGLILIHSRHAQSVRATSVLFEQMMRHLKVLDKMPGHEGALVLSCGKVKIDDGTDVIQYRILFGNMILQRTSHDNEHLLIHGKQGAYLNRALDQTFDYLVQYGIESLFLQLPGEQPDKIDELRLALNIVARFQDAVERHGTVTFHYGERPLAVSLIHNPQGEPDFNLTLLAGVNGLSKANAEELIKQAQAFHDLALAANRDSTQPLKVVKGSYNQIFKVRSLRSQIIRPLVEVNNIPWIGVQPESGNDTDTSPGPTEPEPTESDGHGQDAGAEHQKEEISYVQSLTLFIQPADDVLSDSGATQQYLMRHLAGDDSAIQKDLATVLIDDYTGLNTQDIGACLVASSRLLHAIDKMSQDPAVGDRLLYFLQDRLLQVDDQVLAHIKVQNQGIRLIANGRTMVVGLVHPRLVDMIVLINDQVMTRNKIAAIGNIAFGFEKQFTDLVADTFNVSSEDARLLLNVFSACFDAKGGFNRDAFEKHMESMAQQANTFFEVNWCFLQATPHGMDRLALLNAVQLLMVRLKDPKRALRFLLDDLCSHADQVGYTDRNAFVLGNVLMQAENKSLHVDLEHTPDSILSHCNNVDNEVHRYALWRVNTDQIRVVKKLDNIHDALENALHMSASGKTAAVEFLLALEREAFIFLALVKGPTARQILNSMLARYGDSEAPLFKNAAACHSLSPIMLQFKLLVQCMGCAGSRENIASLKAIADNAQKLFSLDTDPSYVNQVNEVMALVNKTIEQLETRNL